MPIELDANTFKDTLAENDIVLVDFWAPWCAPCRSFAPVYENVAENHKDVVFAKVNTEQHQDLAGAFQIRSIPTLMAFRDNIMVFNQAGALPQQALEQLVDAVKALDMDEVRAEVEKQKTE